MIADSADVDNSDSRLAWSKMTDETFWNEVIRDIFFDGLVIDFC